MSVFLQIIAAIAYFAMIISAFAAAAGAVSAVLWPLFGIWGTFSLGIAAIIYRLPAPPKDAGG